MYSRYELNQIEADGWELDDMMKETDDTVVARVYYATDRDTLFTVPSNYRIAQLAAAGKYQAVAEFAAYDADGVYELLQNLDHSWTKVVTPLTSNRRSMSVGDIIVWADRRVEVVDSFGFKTLPTLIGARLRLGETL